MKKAAIALAAAILLIAGVFAGCNGSETGKVSDTDQDLDTAFTEAATDLSEMGNAVSDMVTGNLSETMSDTTQMLGNVPTE